MKLSNIKKQRINAIVDLVKSSSYKDIGNIRSIYEIDFPYFEENLNCLILIGIMIVQNNHLEILVEDYDFTDILVSKIADPKIQMGKLSSFISLFDNIDFVLYPSEFERVMYYEERTFLVEFELVEIDKSAIVIINDYLKKLVSTRRMTLVELDKLNERKKLLGHNAELFAFQFEISEASRFGSIIDQERIKIISDEWVNAGYDLIGFSKDAAKIGKHIEIFIEVKAVHLASPRFFWSTNEIEVAKTYKSRYFLYLVDVDGLSKNRYDSIVIIQDPFVALFNNESKWEWECDSLVFKKGEH